MIGVSEQLQELRSESDVSSVRQRGREKEDTLEVTSSREPSHQVHSLLRQAMNNDREALNELFAHYRDRLYHRLLRLLGNPDDAEEVLQEGLLAAFHHLSTFKGRAQFSTWLTRIVINAGLMRLRRSRLELMTSMDHQPYGREELSWADRLPDPSPNPEEVCARQEQLEIVEHLLQRLPAANRKALWLRDVVGLSTTEAAGALGIPTGSLKSQLHRARIRLREEAADATAVRTIQRGPGGAVLTVHSPDRQFTEKAGEAA
jgi:RNA polymerase sigma-70 factor, ECF subfamily